MNKFNLGHKITIIQISIIENLDIIHNFIFFYICLVHAWISRKYDFLMRVLIQGLVIFNQFQTNKYISGLYFILPYNSQNSLIKTLIVFSLPTSLYTTGHTDEFRIVDRKKYIMIWHPRADQSLTYCLVNYFCTFSNYCPS